MLKSHVKMEPTILAIETSCDETAAAVVKGMLVLGQETYSQLAKHASFGGVVPSIAKLEHELKIDEVINSALNRAQMTLDQMDMIAVTIGPGLAIALEVGVNKAKNLALELNKPLIAVNHMAGHLFSALANKLSLEIEYPSLGILVSGGHSEFILMQSLDSMVKIGETLDDACGEAFDKFARLVGLPYPGGPEVSKISMKVRDEYKLSEKNINGSLILNAKHIKTSKVLSLPIPLAYDKSFNLSYSGLKTAVKNLVASEIGVSNLQNVQDIAQLVKEKGLSASSVEHLCLLFESAAFLQIEKALEKVIKKNPDLKAIILGGGVVANSYFRDQMSTFAERHSLNLHIPTFELSTDNAAMIGIAAGMQCQLAQSNNKRAEEYGIFTVIEDIKKLDRQPGLSF